MGIETSGNHPEGSANPMTSEERQAIAALEQSLWGCEEPIVDDAKRSLPMEEEWGVPPRGENW